jgi:hypothetical protein
MKLYTDEMPKSCGECQCSNFNSIRMDGNHSGICMLSCIFTPIGTIYAKNKHDNCPLRSLASPDTE